jgi:hypothetical protein
MLRLKTAAVQTSGQKIDRPHAVSSAPILLRLHECRNIFPSRIVHLYRYNRTRRRHLKNDARTRAKTWENNRANLDEGRRRAIHDYNLMRNFARLAREAMAMDEAIEKPIRPWVIRSERSLWPEKGARGTVAGFILRRTLQLVDPEIELRLSGLMRHLDERKSLRRALKHAQIEAERD